MRTDIELQPSEAPDNSSESDAPFLGHLEELRHRILICLCVLVAFFLLAWLQSDRLVFLALTPLRKNFPDLRLSALEVTEALFTTIKLAGLAAFVVSLPVVVWQAWSFVSPGLKQVERFWGRVLLLPAMFLFLAGSLFCYLFVLPFTLKILLNTGDFLVPTISYAGFIDFEVLFLVIMGIIFELPLLMVFLDITGLFPAERVREHRSIAIVIAFIVGGIISPPDVVSQFMVSIPILILLESGIWLSLFIRRVKKSPEVS